MGSHPKYLAAFTSTINGLPQTFTIIYLKHLPHQFCQFRVSILGNLWQIQVIGLNIEIRSLRAYRQSSKAHCASYCGEYDFDDKL